MPLQMMFNDADRTICKASLRSGGPYGSSWMIIIMGMRSEILTPFNKFKERLDHYLPCDIPALIPTIALMATQKERGLLLNALARDNVTRFILVFEGAPDRRGDSLKALATTIWRFMSQMTEWKDVLLHIIKRDPVVGHWDIDWREFLAGESGFITMSWFRPLSTEDRHIALERIVLASKSLLQSILSKRHLDDPIVAGLNRWLDSVEALPEVVSAFVSEEEVEI